MTTHTPGPWTVRIGRAKHLLIRSDSGTYVAEVLGREVDEERHANARLIAAAPVMADMIYGWWELEHCEDATCVDHGPLINVLRAAGRLVVAKHAPRWALSAEERTRAAFPGSFIEDAAEPPKEEP